jgi:hypothetical protein
VYHPSCVSNRVGTTRPTTLSIFEVGELHVGVEGSRGAIEPAVVDLCVIGLELQEAMVDTVLIVIGEQVRCSSDLIRMLLKGGE